MVEVSVSAFIWAHSGQLIKNWSGNSIMVGSTTEVCTENLGFSPEKLNRHCLSVNLRLTPLKR